MPDGDALIFLRTVSLPAGNLRDVIIMCETLTEAFENLDTQFGIPEDEISVLKSKFIDK